MCIKINEKNNKFLLAANKFIPEMHLKQLDITYSSCGPFTKNKQRIKKFQETGDTTYIYKNELDKACFQHDMAYGDFKDLARRKVFDKALRDKAFNFASNPRYHRYQRGLASMVYNFFHKKSTLLPDKPVSSRGVNINVKLRKKLAEELHGPIIRKFEKTTVYSGSK